MTAQLGTIYLLDSCMVFAAPQLFNEQYTDYPISVILGVHGEVTSDLGDHSVTARGLLVQNGIERRLQAPNGVVDFLVGLDSPYYGYLRRHFSQQDIVPIDAEKVDALQSELLVWLNGEKSADELHAATCDIFEQLFGPSQEEDVMDSRLLPVLNYLRTELPINPPINELAEMAGLSASRLMHVFKEQLGLPVRQYLLWKKIETAARFHAEGHSLLDISNYSGFYDQAHFTRTVRRMLDIPPSVLTDSRNIQVIASTLR